MNGEERQALRGEMLRLALREELIKRAEREHARLLTFAGHLALDESTETVALYLMWLVEDQGKTSRQASNRLTLIDLARRLRGDEGFRRTEAIRLFMRGLFREQDHGFAKEEAEPIYRETLHVIVDSVMAPDKQQIRDKAVVLLQAATGWSGWTLGNLRWDQVIFRRERSVMLVPVPDPNRPTVALEPATVRAQRGPLCPVRAMQRLREVSSGTGPVFGFNENSVFPIRARKALALARQLGDLHDTIQCLSVTPTQIRDRAILLVAWSLGAMSHEITALRQSDIEVADPGLIVSVHGRPWTTLIRREPGSAYCPVAAWEAWLGILEHQGRRSPAGPAFARVWRWHARDEPLEKPGLRSIVRDQCAQAGLDPLRFSFQSLRWGYIRTAFRSDEHIATVAQHVGLRSVAAAETHHRREHILNRSVAGRVGL